MDKVSFDDSDFRRSSFSGGDAGTCVEVAVRDGVIGVRDSKDVEAGVLVFTEPEWAAFLKGVRAGEFDLG